LAPGERVGFTFRGHFLIQEDDMPAKPKPIPDGYHAVTPYLIVDGAAKAIDFYKRVFGASERMRFENEGKIGHAELEIGDSVIMLADEHPEMGARSPKATNGSPVSLMLYVTDVDAVVQKGVEAGARLARPIENKFYGDRTGCIEDPFGHTWFVSTHVEDVSPEEMQKRAAAVATAQ
jgi:PhnB protein